MQGDEGRTEINPSFRWDAQRPSHRGIPHRAAAPRRRVAEAFRQPHRQRRSMDHGNTPRSRIGRHLVEAGRQFVHGDRAGPLGEDVDQLQAMRTRQRLPDAAGRPVDGLLKRPLGLFLRYSIDLSNKQARVPTCPDQRESALAQHALGPLDPAPSAAPSG